MGRTVRQAARATVHLVVAAAMAFGRRGERPRGPARTAGTPPGRRRPGRPDAARLP
ncbi:hypothetical protein SBD_6569 [Streptomyces bottropensis ATCC 25435]|uniref:Uncharacterized protein n=1 Tax=Streptomyces bottropensis ATCC 25435 TaxID=1054862 RepID=M3D754_9ACTN|nr:hypothetical protein SBD_6569 [Streptomyces bottropensis ATCC 25435]